MNQSALYCFDAETEILSDLGWVKLADFDKQLYAVAVVVNGAVTYPRVIAYATAEYTGDAVRISTSHGDIVTSPHAKFVTENGVTTVGSLTAGSGILAAPPPVNDKFLERLKQKYGCRADGYRYRVRTGSPIAAQRLQRASVLAGYAATVVGRNVTVRSKRYIRCVCAEFVPVESMTVWNVVVDGPGGLVFVRRDGVVYMACVE